jgi:3-oxoacyl-[acyl-carrier protein] reductase
MLLKDKVALITGAGNGIGRATAVRFAQEGAKLVLTDLDKKGLEATAGEVGDSSEITTMESNVTVRDDVQKMVDTTVEQFGRLDILINNAGINMDGLTTRVKDGEVKFMSDDKWDVVINVNLKGTWLCSQIAAVPMIQQKYGRIVNTSSVGALGNVGQSNYSASKAGVIGLTSTLALEWARYNIAVNCVAPGATKTQMTAGIPEKILEKFLERIPFQRMAEPEEVSAAHLFLASDMASFITGQVLFVDGGMSVGT